MFRVGGGKLQVQVHGSAVVFAQGFTQVQAAFTQVDALSPPLDEGDDRVHVRQGFPRPAGSVQGFGANQVGGDGGLLVGDAIGGQVSQVGLLVGAAA